MLRCILPASTDSLYLFKQNDSLNQLGLELQGLSDWPGHTSYHILDTTAGTHIQLSLFAWKGRITKVWPNYTVGSGYNMLLV